jgi:hypothetical protein
MEYPKTRAEAKASGAAHYFTGLPCARGHTALRKTKGACVECMKEDWALDNEKRKGKPKSAAAKAAGQRYYAKNKDAVKARANARPKEEVHQYKKVHKQNNPDYYKSLTNVRKRRHREATPKWVDAEQKLAMRKTYLAAMQLTRVSSERYVVDHIYPLISPVVCGLHVPWNLRVMTQVDNLKKSNSLPDDSEALAFPPNA